MMRGFILVSVAIRVVQNNLIYVSGLPQEEDKCKENAKLLEHFSKFGKVIKIEVNNKSTYQDANGNSTVCAYITFERIEDAMKAVVCEHIKYENRPVRMTFGTTKYCSQFLKGSKCTKPECMYLHALGDEEASFTKADMDQGKHRVYMEKIVTKFKEEHPEIVNDLAIFASPPRLTKRRSPIQPESSLTVQREESPPIRPVPSTSRPPVTDTSISSSESNPIPITDTVTSTNVSRVNKSSRSSTRSNEHQLTVRPSSLLADKFASKVTSSAQQPTTSVEDLTPTPHSIPNLHSQPPIFHAPKTTDRSQFNSILSSSAANDIGFDPYIVSSLALDSLMTSGPQTAPPQMPPITSKPHQSSHTQTPFNPYSALPPPPGFENSPNLQPHGYPQHLIDNAMKNRNSAEIRPGIMSNVIMDLALQLVTNSTEEQLREHVRQVLHAERMAEFHRITDQSRRQRMAEQQHLDELSVVLRYAMNMRRGNETEANLTQSSSVQRPGPSSSRAATLNQRGGYLQ
nr:CCR4 NOT transcription complex subunit 4 [Hymenolepis microstoma]